MSVTGFMYNINATKKLGEIELNEGYEGNRSWHHQFKDSAYVYVGGLKEGLTEGDVVIVFSQFGEIIDVNLTRDRGTGKSKGFCFLCYEDQRSTVLAVDNMNGAQLLGRTLNVSHVDKYKAPKNLDEENLDENGDPTLLEYNATGAEGAGRAAFNVTAGQKRIADVEAQRKRRNGGPVAPEDEDEAWAKQFEASLNTCAGADKKKGSKDKLKKDMKELEDMKKEAKRLKKEAKQFKKTGKGKKGAKDSKSAAKQAVKVEGKRKRAKSESSSSGSDSSSSSSEDSPDSSDKRGAKKASGKKTRR